MILGEFIEISSFLNRDAGPGPYHRGSVPDLGPDSRNEIREIANIHATLLPSWIPSRK